MKICLPSELGYEKFAMMAVAAVARQLGFDTHRIDCLKTAIAEAVTNAIEHGNQLNTEIGVLIGLHIQENALVLNVIDQGYRPIPQIPAVRQEREDHRGWGLFLIKNLVDEVEVVAAPGRNEIRMVAYKKIE
ncbi:MAG: ATP-binding protein [Anaerolineae bacterium]|nr:ATP-binding protein [Anaerolineales bacterium]MCQ3977919.1 ATP-binding protein [Anaerolineae bacterium]